MTDLDGFVRRVTRHTAPRRCASDPVLLDVPSGGGTLLPRLAAQGYAGRVEADLGVAMLARARRMEERTPARVVRGAPHSSLRSPGFAVK